MIACNDYNYFEMTNVITITEYPRNSLQSAVSHSKIIYKKKSNKQLLLKVMFFKLSKEYVSTY